jgi:hypothetical protein
LLPVTLGSESFISRRNDERHEMVSVIVGINIGNFQRMRPRLPVILLGRRPSRECHRLDLHQPRGFGWSLRRYRNLLADDNTDVRNPQCGGTRASKSHTPTARISRTAEPHSYCIAGARPARSPRTAARSRRAITNDRSRLSPPSRRRRRISSVVSSFTSIVGSYYRPVSSNE